MEPQHQRQLKFGRGAGGINPSFYSNERIHNNINHHQHPYGVHHFQMSRRIGCPPHVEAGGGRGFGRNSCNNNNERQQICDRVDPLQQRQKPPRFQRRQSLPVFPPVYSHHQQNFNNTQYQNPDGNFNDHQIQNNWVGPRMRQFSHVSNQPFRRFIGPRPNFRQNNGQFAISHEMDSSYIPSIPHYPILQLYKNEEQVEAYCPQPVAKNPIVTGYSKLTRNSTGSSESLSTISSLPEDDDNENDTKVFQMDAKKLQLVIQNFIKIEATQIPIGAGESGDRRVIKQKKFDVDGTSIVPPPTTLGLQKMSEETPSPSPPNVRIKTPHGFYCDKEGFVEVYTYGILNKHEKSYNLAAYGVWFGEGNTWNCSDHLSSGLQTVKGANIQGAEKAILLLKKNGFSKIKINTDSTFMFTNVRNWAVKLISSHSGNPFVPSNWDEFKYTDEIRRLCDTFSEVIVKWTLVDPKCFGTKKAKMLAGEMKMEYIESNIKNYESKN